MEHLMERQKYLLNSLKKDSELKREHKINYLNVYERMLVHQEISSLFSKKSGKKKKRYAIPKSIEEKITKLQYEII